jgi:hypothetical protein
MAYIIYTPGRAVEQASFKPLPYGTGSQTKTTVFQLKPDPTTLMHIIAL